jgi:hypothetical protein
MLNNDNAQTIDQTGIVMYPFRNITHLNALKPEMVSDSS